MAQRAETNRSNQGNREELRASERNVMETRTSIREWPYLVLPCAASAFIIGTALLDATLGFLLAFVFGVLSMAGFAAWTAR